MAKNSDEMGALWIKTSARGEFLTGKIGDVAVVAFRNHSKKNPNEPDWRILKARPKDDAAGSQERPMHNANAGPLDDF